MTSKTMLAALLALPLLTMGCNKAPSAATSAADSPNNQATASTPDKTMNSAPPAAGTPSDSGAPAASSMSPSAPGAAPPPADTSGSQQGGTNKNSY